MRYEIEGVQGTEQPGGSLGAGAIFRAGAQFADVDLFVACLLC